GAGARSRRRTLAPMPSARARSATNMAQPPASGCKAWSTWPTWSRPAGSRRASASSSTIESSPPLVATRTRGSPASAASQRPSVSLTAAPGSGAGLLELAIREQALLALGDQFLRPQTLDLSQGIGDRAPQGLRHRVDIAVRAPDRLADHAIDEAEGLQALRRDAERGGRLGGLVGTLPQDGGATFGGNHRIDRELQHEHGVGDGQCESAARSALADHDGDDRHPERRHLDEIAPDRLR